MHVAEIMIRKAVWEVYSIHDAINLQSTYEMVTVLQNYATPVYNHNRFEPTIGDHYNGIPYQYDFAPYDNLLKRFWRESFNADF